MNSKPRVKIVLSTDHLEHYGVLGMRWGKRKDGSKGSARANNKRYKKIMKDARKADIGKMSDKELRDKINRLSMEKQYRQITAKELSTGKSVAKSIITDAAKEVAKNRVKEVMNVSLKTAEKMVAKSLKKKK